MKVERHRAVIAEDLPRIYRSIVRDNPAAAERLLEAVDEMLGQIAQHPECGISYRTRNPKLADLRMLPVAGFGNYLLFYRVEPEAVRVLYVVHGARHLPRFFRRERRE